MLFINKFHTIALTLLWLSPPSSAFLRVVGGASPPMTTSALGSQDTPLELPAFDSEEDYIKFMSSGVSDLPKGFSVGSAKGTFVSVEAPALGNLPIKGTVIYLPDGPTDNWAAVFTRNKFPGAPVIVGKQRRADKGPLQAIIVNNKVSNVCSGGDGVADSERVCQAVADALKLKKGPKSVLPSSTGVIGWRLPADALADSVVPEACANLQSESALVAAKAIMTTDRWPKVRSKTLSSGARLVGIAKGAGMIEPNMATMLSYLMTDADVPRDTLQVMLEEVVNQSYNSISVDGDESTSDTVVAICSNKVKDTDVAEFKEALMQICGGLAADIVRNGEGTGHVMRVTIANFPGTDFEARRLGRHIVNSPLFKCAVSGNDPNTGRLAGAIGSFMGKFKDSESVESMTLRLGGRPLFANGKFILDGDEAEKALSGHISDAAFDEHSMHPPHQKFVEIDVNFGASGGAGKAVVMGSDLTAEYVAVNADYRS